MFKSKQTNNGNGGVYHHANSTVFFKNVLIGAFFSCQVSDGQIKQAHNSAVETHNSSVRLHEETQQKILQTEQLLMGKIY